MSTADWLESPPSPIHPPISIWRYDLTHQMKKNILTWHILTWHIVKMMSCNFQGWILREPQGLPLHLGMVHLETYISLSEKAQASTQRGWHVRELKTLPVHLSSWSAASTNIQLDELVHVQTSRYPLL